MNIQFRLEVWEVFYSYFILKLENSKIMKKMKNMKIVFMHLSYIATRVNVLSLKLWPALTNASRDFRINLWTVLVRPLFEMLTGLYINEEKTNKERIESVIRKSFKKFTLLKRNTSDKVIYAMMDFNFDARAEEVINIAQKKWDARKNHQIPNLGTVYKKSAPAKETKIFYPKELQILLNQKTAICPHCTVPCGSGHMIKEHNIHIPSNMTLLDTMREVSRQKAERGLNRSGVVREAGRTLGPFIQAMGAHLNNNKNNRKVQIKPAYIHISHQGEIPSKNYMAPPNGDY